MLSFWDFLQDLTNPVLIFLPKALLVAVLSSIVCGVVGAHVVLRGMAFVGDALAHAVFPGLAIAFALGASLLLGAAVAGVSVAVLVAFFSQNRRLKEDSLIGIFFAAAFALGLVVIAQVPGYSGSLTSFLFGSITGVPDEDLVVVGVTCVVILLLLFCFHRELVSVSLDREFASAQRLPVFAIDMLLYLMVTAAVVVSVRTIGNILVLALLIIPAAIARMLTDKLVVMMLLGPIFGSVSAVFGIYLSWSLGLPTGASIVLVLSSVFLCIWLFAPRAGAIRAMVNRFRNSVISS